MKDKLEFSSISGNTILAHSLIVHSRYSSTANILLSSAPAYLTILQSHTSIILILVILPTALRHLPMTLDFNYSRQRRKYQFCTEWAIDS